MNEVTNALGVLFLLSITAACLLYVATTVWGFWRKPDPHEAEVKQLRLDFMRLECERLKQLIRKDGELSE